MNKWIFFLLTFVNLLAISSSKNLIIECKTINAKYSKGDVQTCDLKQISPSLENKSDKIEKCFEENTNCRNAYAFQASEKNIFYFPKELKTFFPSLLFISIHKCGLKEIHSEDFENYADLKELHLQNNDIEILEENLFKFTGSLEKIYLNSNRIYYMHPEVFKFLGSLKSFSFENNVCTNDNKDDKTGATVFMIATKVAIQCNFKYIKDLRMILSNEQNLTKNKIIELENLTATLKNTRAELETLKLETSILNNTNVRLQNEKLNSKILHLENATTPSNLLTTIPTTITKSVSASQSSIITKANQIRTTTEKIKTTKKPTAKILITTKTPTTTTTKPTTTESKTTAKFTTNPLDNQTNVKVAEPTSQAESTTQRFIERSSEDLQDIEFNIVILGVIHCILICLVIIFAIICCQKIIQRKLKNQNSAKRLDSKPIIKDEKNIMDYYYSKNINFGRQVNSNQYAVSQNVAKNDNMELYDEVPDSTYSVPRLITNTSSV